MIIFWKEEELQDYTEEKENQACKELLLQLIAQLDNKKEHLKFLDKDELAEGIDIAKDILVHRIISYVRVNNDNRTN